MMADYLPWLMWSAIALGGGTAAIFAARIYFALRDIERDPAFMRDVAPRK